MILSEYQAKREDLEKEMEAITARQSEQKMELSIKHQKVLQKINNQINSLKHQRAEETTRYENEKSWFHAKYRDEKHQVTQKIHALRMEYLTVNGLEDKRPSQITPPFQEGSIKKEEPKNE